MSGFIAMSFQDHFPLYINCKQVYYSFFLEIHVLSCESNILAANISDCVELDYKEISYLVSIKVQF